MMLHALVPPPRPSETCDAEAQALLAQLEVYKRNGDAGAQNAVKTKLTNLKYVTTGL